MEIAVAIGITERSERRVAAPRRVGPADAALLAATVEDAGRVTGFISRFGDGESDKGAFLDQFFKTGKLEGNKLSFTTEVVHGVDARVASQQ